jgi:uncharacterized protein
MILVDTNLLIYATVKQMPQHEKAKTWLSGALENGPSVAIPWSVSLAYIRLLSNPRVMEKPVPIPDCWNQIQNWLKLSQVWVPQPTARHQEILGEMLTAVSNSNHIPDAELAALTVGHGLQLMTADRGFARYPGLRFSNPLAE